MALVIQKEGILDSIQDLGRFGYRQAGINPGGAMDTAAVRILNTLVGNKEDEAVIELHFPAGQMLFEEPALLAVGGADLAPHLNGVPVDGWKTVVASGGDVLDFRKKIFGNRAYLTVAGGFQIPEWLGSKCTNLAAAAGGFKGRRLVKGDRIDFAHSLGDSSSFSPLRAGYSLIPGYGTNPTIRVTAGIEFDGLNETAKGSLCTDSLAVSTVSNRMGYRLDGKALSFNGPSGILSSAVCAGTVQLLPDGQMIVLMADHQTTGGYPRIAHVIQRDIPLLAQLGPGNKVTFQLVGIVEAEQLEMEFERELNLLRIGRRLNVVG